MKVGVVQMRMGWTVRENLKTIVSHVENMRALDALVFPELSLSGFHRNIKQESEQVSDSQRYLLVILSLSTILLGSEA